MKTSKLNPLVSLPSLEKGKRFGSDRENWDNFSQQHQWQSNENGNFTAISSHPSSSSSCGSIVDVMANQNLPELQVDGKDKDDGCKDDEEGGEAGKGDGNGQDGLVGGAEGGGESGAEG